MSKDTKNLRVVPTLTEDTKIKDQLDDQTSVINGRTIDVRLTHPGLYWLQMLSAAWAILLGFNFLFLNPTFLILDQPNYLWGSIFLAFGLGEIVFLNIVRNLKFVRIIQAASFSYIMLVAYGTCQPFVEGEGSLQLPLLYAGWAILHVAMLLEPFINPWTARQK